VIRATFIIFFAAIIPLQANANTDFLTRSAFVKEISMWPDSARLSVGTICTTPNSNPDSGTLASQIHEFLREMSLDPVGARLVRRLKEADVIICQYAGFGQRGYFDNEVNMIGFEPILTPGQKLLILTHEARHLDQYLKGFARTLDYSLDEYVRFTFFLESDAQAIATLVAWNLKELGHSRAWKGLLSLDNYRQTGRAFEGVYYGTVGRGNKQTAKTLATAYAFRAWLDNPWLTSVYRAGSKGMYFDELEDSKRIQKYEHAPLSFYAKLCVDDGFNYPCLMLAPPAQGISRDRK
jgi:hypothetical protein